jgi:hypothetical protein
VSGTPAAVCIQQEGRETGAAGRFSAALVLLWKTTVVFYEKPLWFNIGKPFRFCIGEYLLTKSLFGVVIEKWVRYN